MQVCKFTIAVDRYGKKDEADFPRITVFGKQAENCNKYLSKGKMVGITGRLQTGSYEDNEGRKVYTTDVVANNVEFLTPKGKDEPQEKQDSFQALDEDVPF